MLRLALGAEKESVQAAQLKPQPHRPRLPTSLRPAIQQQPPKRWPMATPSPSSVATAIEWAGVGRGMKAARNFWSRAY